VPGPWCANAGIAHAAHATRNATHRFIFILQQIETRHGRQRRSRPSL
jgi:hypothetical protein